MEIGHFYYIKDCYFADFQDDKLMHNKETIDGIVHDRPYFCAFIDDKTGLYWMVPISSQTTKFKKIYNDKIRKRGKCDTITFHNVLGRSKAFLIQNMCPVTDNYINNEYLVYNTDASVRINNLSEKRIIEKSLKILSLHRNGIHVILVDVAAIEAALLSPSCRQDSVQLVKISRVYPHFGFETECGSNIKNVVHNAVKARLDLSLAFVDGEPAFADCACIHVIIHG